MSSQALEKLTKSSASSLGKDNDAMNNKDLESLKSAHDAYPNEFFKNLNKETTIPMINYLMKEYVSLECEGKSLTMTNESFFFLLESIAITVKGKIKKKKMKMMVCVVQEHANNHF